MKILKVKQKFNTLIDKTFIMNLMLFIMEEHTKQMKI